MNIIVISLVRAKERRKSMEEQLKSLNLDAVFYDCFDTKDVKNPTFGANFSLKGGYREGTPMKGGEVACGLSHIVSLSIAKAMKWEYAIILEDDIIIAKDFVNRINFLFKILPKDWEHVYLTGIPRFRNYFNKINLPQVLQVTPSLVSRVDTTAAFIVRNTAYDKVIKKLTSLETTPDDLITHMILDDKMLNSFLYLPFPIHVKDESSYIWDVQNSKNHQSKQFYFE